MGLEPSLAESHMGLGGSPSSGLVVNRRHRRRTTVTVVGLALNHVSTFN
jgi:hypothetical protein